MDELSKTEELVVLGLLKKPFLTSNIKVPTIATTTTQQIIIAGQIRTKLFNCRLNIIKRERVFMGFSEEQSKVI